MNVAIKRKIETTEPVQLTIDSLEKMLSMSNDEEINNNYWDIMIKEKRREIMEDYYALAPLLSTMQHGLCYSEGLESGRLLVMRILLGILPSAVTSDFSLTGVNKNIHRSFREVVQYLKTLYMANEGDHVLWKNAVNTVIGILRKNGFSPYFFRRGGWPVLVTAPPYREITAACYLLSSHTIVLYSNREISLERRCYYFLHELGHLIFQKYFNRHHAPGFFTDLISQLPPSDFGQFLYAGSQGTEEIFANLFAFTLLMDTPPGNHLFSSYYENTSHTCRLLKKFFNPSSLLRHR